jgi:hypothetical protein
VCPRLRTSSLADFCQRPCVSAASAQRFRRTDSNAMSNGKSPTLWIYDHAPTRWVIVGVFVVAWFLAIVFLFSDIVKVLAARPWWEDSIVAMAAVAVPVLAFFELLHSGEANRLRDEAPTKNGVRLIGSPNKIPNSLPNWTPNGTGISRRLPAVLIAYLKSQPLV